MAVINGVNYPNIPNSVPSPTSFLPNSNQYWNDYNYYMHNQTPYQRGPGTMASPQAPNSYPAISALKAQFNVGDPNTYGLAQDVGDLDMIRATGQSVLANNYFQTPGYQLLFGSGMQQMDPTLSPTERYVESPGFQYQIENALRNVQRNSAARGLLESGATQRDMLENAVGLGLQDYNNWWNQLSGNYENYQNRLASLASAGMGVTGGQQALATAGGQSGNTMQTGQGIGSLLANQGMAGLGAYMNTGAGMSSNTMQGLGIQAQIDAANAANQQSMMGGIGQIAGSLLGGLF